MRTYVKFDGKDAVPEWVEDCFECISEPALGVWAFFCGGCLWEAVLSEDKTEMTFHDMNGWNFYQELLFDIRAYADGLDELRLEYHIIDDRTIKVRFYYDN